MQFNNIELDYIVNKKVCTNSNKSYGKIILAKEGKVKLSLKQKLANMFKTRRQKGK